MNLTCYILDDEPHSIGILKAFVEKTPGTQLCGNSTDPLQALEDISALKPAITFLDIDMPELNGLDFAGYVKGQTTIVFTTAYCEYAVEAFEKAASDYLLKPISYERFLACIQKIRSLPAATIKEGPKDRVFVKTGIKGKLAAIHFSEIRYITGCDHYVEIHLQEEKVITYLTLTELMAKLPEGDFSRIHKSYIAGHRYLQSIEPGQVVIQGNVTLPIGRAYRESFFNKLKNDILVSKWDQTH